MDSLLFQSVLVAPCSVSGLRRGVYKHTCWVEESPSLTWGLVQLCTARPHCWLMSSCPPLPSCFQQVSCLPSYTGVFPPQMLNFTFLLAKLHEAPHGLNSPACQGSSEWQQSSLVYQMLLPVLYLQWTCWGGVLSYLPWRYLRWLDPVSMPGAQH